MQRSRVDVHRLVRETVALLGRTLDRRIAIAVDLQAPASWLDGDAALLQNALVNLAINARDAMPEGGRLRIATAAAAPPEGAAGAWMSISVADTGCGIPADVLPHVCEAFFTTKPVGKGSGLGLAAVQGTVQRHGGRMAIASEVGRGTEITILLPVAAPPDTARRERLETRTPRPGLRLLLVDDEDLVRTMAEEELAELGYQVQAFADGHLAVAALAADPDACDGAVLDLVMPRIGGVETLQRLRAIRPDLPVLLWSGYSAGHDVEPLLSDGRTAFIAKPATHEALGRALAGLLAHPPAR
jgi:CheY-like chemotaxis protein